MTKLKIIFVFFLLFYPIQVVAGFIEDITKAAEQGDPSAQEELGGMYHNGQGVTRDSEKAAHWYTKAAQQGKMHSQGLLGSMYKMGDGVAKDINKATYWYTKAAQQGEVYSQAILGALCEENKDFAAAAKWYEMAAQQKNNMALLRLGVLCAFGQGVPVDKIKAFNLWLRAAKQGDTAAQNNLDMLCKESPWACK